MSQKPNHVTLFGQGMGHVFKRFTVPANTEKRISIPFKKDHISDALASLSVFGHVRINTPPSFTPDNTNSTSLKIDPSAALSSLVKGLSGARVRLPLVSGGSIEGNLLGMDEVSNIGLNGETCTTERIVIENEGLTLYSPVAGIKGVEFLDEAVRAEIDKARRSNFQKIKPESTFLELSLSAIDLDGQSKDEEAIVQYTIPIAAWKMRYAIRIEEDRSILEASVIVDNNTDEDWNNTIISVVTGNPISFTTDLAKVTVPKRQHVNLVDDETPGAVQAATAEVYRSAGRLNKGAIFAANSTPSAYTTLSASNRVGFGMVETEAVGSSMEALSVAEAPGMESREIGDFCVFTSKEPVSIFSKKSAIVDMFSVPLTNAGSVLLYKKTNHSRRPFQAFKFKNDTGHTLGRGKVVFSRDSLYQGEAILETAKAGENRILAYCLESGVRIIPSDPKLTTRRTKLKFNHGLGYEEIVQTAVTTYSIENFKEEEFKLLLEHVAALGYEGAPKFSGMEVREVEKTTEGYRAYLTIGPKQKGVLRVVETEVTESEVSLENNFAWLYHKVVGTKNPLIHDAHVLKCVELNNEAQKVFTKIGELDARKKEIATQVDRVRANYQATKDDGASEIRANWLADLDASEKEIRQIDKVERPAAVAEKRDLERALAQELNRLSAEWVSQPGTDPNWVATPE